MVFPWFSHVPNHQPDMVVTNQLGILTITAEAELLHDLLARKKKVAAMIYIYIYYKLVLILDETEVPSNIIIIYIYIYVYIQAYICIRQMPGFCPDPQ